MALLNSTVLRSSRGGAPLLPMPPQTQPVALRSGSSNILMAGQNVAVHSCANGGSCVCSAGRCDCPGTDCRGATTMTKLSTSSLLTQSIRNASPQQGSLISGVANTKPTQSYERAFASRTGGPNQPSLLPNKNIGPDRWYKEDTIVKQGFANPDALRAAIEARTIAAECPTKCNAAQCGSVAVQYTYTDPVTQKKMTGKATCPCAVKSCPAPLECNGNQCDCPAGGVDVGKPCGDTSPGGCSCVGFGSSFSAVECYKGACFDSGPCGINLEIQIALDKYLASGGTLAGANSQKWSASYWTHKDNKGIPWPNPVNNMCGIEALRQKLLYECGNAKLVPLPFGIISITPSWAPC
jgi:hypothetical protein